MTRITFLLWIALSFLLWDCQDSSVSIQEQIPIDLDPSQEALKEAYRYYNLGILDSASYLLHDFNPNNKIWALRTFSNFENASQIDSIISLLDDPVVEVRREAIYALGQIGYDKAVSPLLGLFSTTDTTRYDETSFALALEAVGKLGNAELMDSMRTVDSYSSDQTELWRAKDKGLFNFLLRDIYSDETTEYFISNLTNPDDDRKMIASQYLARVPQIPAVYHERLALAIDSLSDSSHRIALIRAIGKTKSRTGIRKLLSLYNSAHRNEKLAILQALSSAEYVSIRTTVEPLFNDPDPEIGKRASELCITTASNSWGKHFFSRVNNNYPWYVKANLLAATNKFFHSPQAFVNINRGYIQNEINTSANEEQKLAFIDAWSHSRATSSRLLSYFDTEDKVKMASMIADAIGRGDLEANSTVISFIKNKLNNSNDVALMSIGAQMALSNATVANSFSTEEIKKWQDLCTLPEFSEPYVLFQMVSDRKNKKDTKGQYVFNNVKPKYFPPIQGPVSASVNTTKGNFVIKLLWQDAPVSVANFIDLVESDFFSNKSFHRVVPNFVIQTGDPRGDMYGALDYVIPTETPNVHYSKKGMVGMASGGRNTESCQWFVTLGPTPHLDGKYTLFGEVIEGLDVLEKITTKDDIRSIQIVKNNTDAEEDPTL